VNVDPGAAPHLAEPHGTIKKAPSAEESGPPPAPSNEG
jgi:hypothetical protein